MSTARASGAHSFSRVCLLQRVRFLEHVAATVPLANVSSQWGAMRCELGLAMRWLMTRVRAGRAEEMGHDVLHREQYDVAVARAVAELRCV